MVKRTVEVDVKFNLYDVVEDMTTDEIIDLFVDYDANIASWKFSLKFLNKLIEEVPLERLNYIYEDEKPLAKELYYNLKAAVSELEKQGYGE